MANTEQDEVRERRIADEIVVDAYGEEEQALGWYYYLEDRLAGNAQPPLASGCLSEPGVLPRPEDATLDIWQTESGQLC